MLKQGKGLKKTALKKVSEKKKTEDPQIKKDQREEDWKFYMELWNERPHKCQNCGAPIFTEHPSTVNMDHLLPKAKFGELRYEKDNIFICCWGCHSKKESGFPGKLHLEAIEKAKLKFGK